MVMPIVINIFNVLFKAPLFTHLSTEKVVTYIDMLEIGKPRTAIKENKLTHKKHLLLSLLTSFGRPYCAYLHTFHRC